MQAPTAAISRTETLLIVGVTAFVWILNSQFILLRPLLWMATYVHESMHAFTAMLLGLPVRSVTINSKGGGLTYTGGHRSTLDTIVVASAGYVGAALVGAIALELCKLLRSARIVCLGMAALIATVGLLWVPWNFHPDAGSEILTGSSSGEGHFTMLFWIAASIAFVLIAAQPSVRIRRASVLVVATTLCLLSVESLKMVLDWSARGGDSDATTAAAVTPLSSWMWSAIWLVFGILMCLAGLWSLVRGRNSSADETTGF